MKHSRVVIVASLVLVVAVTASARMAIISDYLSFPVLLKWDEERSASGFYYRTGSNMYFVTAKHVLFDPQNGKLRGDQATLVSYAPGLDNDPKKIIRSISFGELMKDNRIETHPKHDVCVVRFAQMGKKDDGSLYFVYSGRFFRDVEGQHSVIGIAEPNTKRYKDVLISNEVYIFGYPRSIGIKQMPQIDYDMPLLRRGIVAGKNSGPGTIIIDCPVYYGNSGGPVCEVESEGLETRFRIIGLVSQFVPFVEQWENKTHHYVNVEMSNSGYSIVSPIDAMFDLIEKQEGAEQGESTVPSEAAQGAASDVR